MIIKTSNILDWPKKGLNPEIWDENNLLRPEVKKFILDFVYSFAQANNLNYLEEWVSTIKFVGSLTTNLWNSHSDVDIHIVVNLPKFIELEHPEMSEKEASDYLDEIRKQVDRVKAKIPGTEHPIELYNETPNLTTASTAFSGAYSILEDKWLTEPHIVDQDFDISTLHPDLLNLAKETASELDAAFGEIKRDVQDIRELNETINDWPVEQRELLEKKLQKRLDELEKEIKDLVDLREDVAEKRKHYDAVSEQEVRFKYLQKYFYMHVLTDLKTLLKQSPSLTIKDIPVVENIMAQASLEGEGYFISPEGEVILMDAESGHPGFISDEYGSSLTTEEMNKKLVEMLSNGWTRVREGDYELDVEVFDMLHLPVYLEEFMLKYPENIIIHIQDNKNKHVSLDMDDISVGLQEAVNKALSRKRMQQANLKKAMLEGKYWISPQGIEYKVEELTHTDWVLEHHKELEKLGFDLEPLKRALEDVLEEESPWDNDEVSAAIFELNNQMINQGWIRISDDESNGIDYGIQVGDIRSISPLVDDFLARHSPNGAIYVEDAEKWVEIDNPFPSLQKAVNKALQQKRMHQASLHKKTDNGVYNPNFWIDPQGEVFNLDDGEGHYDFVQEMYESSDLDPWDKAEEMKANGWTRGSLFGKADVDLILDVFDLNNLPSYLDKFVSEHFTGKGIEIEDSKERFITVKDPFPSLQKAVNKALSHKRLQTAALSKKADYWVSPEGHLIDIGPDKTHEEYIVETEDGQDINDLDADEINEVVWDYMGKGWVRIYSASYAQFGIETADDTNLPPYIDDIVSKLYNPNDERPIEVGSYGSHVSIVNPFPSLQKAVNKALSHKRLQGALSKKESQESEEKILAIDFDDTIVHENPDHSLGTPMDGVREALTQLKNDGYKLEIYSHRADTKEGADEIKEYLDKNDIPYDSIFHGDKPLATYYIDDRGLMFTNWSDIVKKVEEGVGKEANLNIDAVDAYYHGGSGASIRQIAKDGYVMAPLETGRAYQSPLAGRSYLTKDLGYALIYALGGDMVGQDVSDVNFMRGEGGIVLVVPNEETLIPDEDWLGQILTDGYEALSKSKPSDNQWFERMTQTPLLRPVFEDMKNLVVRRGITALYDMATQSRLGKKAIKLLMKSYPGFLSEMAKESHALSHEGNLKVLKAWVFDKQRDNPKLKPDGSNFFEIAQEIPVTSGNLVSAALNTKYWIDPNGKEYEVTGTIGYDPIIGHLAWIEGYANLIDKNLLSYDSDGNIDTVTTSENMIAKGWARITTESDHEFDIEISDINSLPTYLDNFIAKYYSQGQSIGISDLDGNYIVVTDPFPNLQKAISKALRQPVHAALSKKDIKADLNPLDDPKLRQGPPYAVYMGMQKGVPEFGLPDMKLYDILGDHPRFGSTVTEQTLKELGIPIRANKKAALGSEYDFSSTHFLLPKEIAEKIVRWAVETIPEEEIVYDSKDPGTKGIQLESHITLKYGLKTNDFEEIKKALDGEKAPHIKFGKTSFFEPEEKDYDVVIIAVESDDLQKLNEKLCSKVEHDDLQFKEYHPHVTVAYVQRGKGKEFDGKDIITGEELDLNVLTFSPKEGEKRELELKKVNQKEASKGESLWIDPNGKIFNVETSHFDWMNSNWKMLKNNYGFDLHTIASDYYDDENPPDFDNYDYTSVVDQLVETGWSRVGDTSHTSGNGIQVSDLRHIPQAIFDVIAKNWASNEQVTIEDLDNWWVTLSAEEAVLGQKAVNKALQQKRLQTQSSFMPSNTDLAPSDDWAGTVGYPTNESMDAPQNKSDEETWYSPENDRPRTKNFWEKMLSLFKRPLSKKEPKEVVPVKEAEINKIAQLRGWLDPNGKFYELDDESDLHVRWARRNEQMLKDQYGLQMDIRKEDPEITLLDAGWTIVTEFIQTDWGVKVKDLRRISSAVEDFILNNIQVNKKHPITISDKTEAYVFLTDISEGLQKSVNRALRSPTKTASSNVFMVQTGEGLDTKVLKDPTPDQAFNLAQNLKGQGEDRYVRWASDSNGHLYMWDGYALVHGDAISQIPADWPSLRDLNSGVFYRPEEAVEWARRFQNDWERRREESPNIVFTSKQVIIEKEADYGHAYWVDPNGKIYMVRPHKTSKDLYTHGDWIADNWKLLQEQYGINSIEDYNETTDQMFTQGWARIGDSGTSGSGYGITVGDLNFIPKGVDIALSQFYEGGDLIVEEDSTHRAVVIDDPFPNIQKAVNKAMQQKRLTTAKQWSTPTEPFNQPGMDWQWADYIYDYVEENWRDLLIGWLELNPKNYVKPIILIEKIYQDEGVVSAWVHIEFVNTAGDTDAFIKLIISAHIEGEQSIEPEGREYYEHLTDWEIEVLDYGKSDSLEKDSSYGPTNYKSPSTPDEKYQDSSWGFNVTYSPEEDEELMDQNGADGWPNRWMSRHRGPYYTNEGKVVKMLEETSSLETSLPEQKFIPENLNASTAIMTDDGSIYWSDEPHMIHVKLIKELGIPVEHIVSGGRIVDGGYHDLGPRSDAMRYVEMELARQRVEKKRKERRALGKKDIKVAVSGQTINDILKLIQTTGGATYNLSKGNLINTSHYAVATHPNRELILDKQIDFDDVEQYLDKNQDLLDKVENSFGAWISGGKTYFDIVATPTDKDEALELGKHYNQLAIFDLKNLEEILIQKNGSLKQAAAVSDREQQKYYDEIYSDRWRDDSDKIDGGNEYYDWSELGSNDYPNPKDEEKEHVYMDLLDDPAKANFPAGLPEYWVTFYNANPDQGDQGGI